MGCMCELMHTRMHACTHTHTSYIFLNKGSCDNYKRSYCCVRAHCEILLSQFVNADLVSSLVLILSLQTQKDESFHLPHGEVNFISHLTSFIFTRKAKQIHGCSICKLSIRAQPLVPICCTIIFTHTHKTGE